MQIFAYRITFFLGQRTNHLTKRSEQFRCRQKIDLINNLCSTVKKKKENICRLDDSKGTVLKSCMLSTLFTWRRKTGTWGVKNRIMVTNPHCSAMCVCRPSEHTKYAGRCVIRGPKLHTEAWACTICIVLVPPAYRCSIGGGGSLMQSRPSSLLTLPAFIVWKGLAFVKTYQHRVELHVRLNKLRSRDPGKLCFQPGYVYAVGTPRGGKSASLVLVA